jgi:UDP-N-acetylglucosamine--N-acetylmuramyl-(pentapeptide) pyrophosphoryl-undecaprenol N-acetylglucosamine transferase
VALSVEPRGGGAPSRARLVLRTPGAVMQARERLIAHRSQVLVGLGGFTSLPAVLAARSLKIPVVLLEVNAHSGAATRWLSRFAARVLHAWHATLPHGEDELNRFVGPPLSPQFHDHALLDERSREVERGRARAQLGFDAGRPLLVVLGGSQGSSALNTFVRTHATALLASGVQVLHQTGPNKLREAAPECGGYRAVEYVDPVHAALRAATIALVRGGASTLAEVAAMRVPAFVAPYPGHADQHQTRNARELGAGVRIVPDANLDVSARDALLRLAGPAGESERAAMSAALAHAVPTDAAVRIFEHIGEIAARNGARFDDSVWIETLRR